MAYPFVPMPTFADFCARLKDEFGCEMGTLVENVNGENVEILYAMREVSGKRLYCELKRHPEDRALAHSELRSVCARLQIDAAKFGFTLG